MTPEEGIRQFGNKVRSVMLRVPVLAGNEVVNFALDNFKQQGFLGNTFQPWAQRRTGWNKDKRTGRNILIDRGRLRRSIRIVYVTQDSVMVGTDVKYARAHNEGARIGVIQQVKSFTRKSGVEVKAHTRRVNINIPKRQFLGNSPYLETRIKRVVSAEFLKTLR